MAVKRDYFVLKDLPGKKFAVPENLIDVYRLSKRFPDSPKFLTAFYLEVYLNIFQYKEFSGGFTSIDDYSTFCRDAVSEIKVSADHLRKIKTDTGITKIVGGGASIVGCALSIAGLALAPITAGASTILTAVGASVAVAGGVTSASASVVNAVYTGKNKQQFQEKLKKFINRTEIMHAFTCEFIKKCKATHKYEDNDSGKALKLLCLKADDLNDSDVIEVMNKIKAATTAGKQVYSSIKTALKIKEIDNIRKGLSLVKQYEIVMYGPSIIEGLKTVRLAKDSVYAAKAIAAPALEVPTMLPKVLGGSSVIFEAGSIGARTLAGAFSAIGIIFGVVDIVQGSLDIKNERNLAAELLAALRRVEDANQHAINMFKKMKAAYVENNSAYTLLIRK